MRKPITIQALQTVFASHLAPYISLYLRPTGACLGPNKTLSVQEPYANGGYTNRDTKALLQPLESLRKGNSGAGKWAASHCSFLGLADALPQADAPSGTSGRGRKLSCAPAVCIFCNRMGNS